VIVNKAARVEDDGGRCLRGLSIRQQLTRDARAAKVCLPFRPGFFLPALIERIPSRWLPLACLYILSVPRNVSAYLNQNNGRDIRLATFASGTIFGELAFLDAGPRSATVLADDDVICYVISDNNSPRLRRMRLPSPSSCFQVSSAS
jgi:hypothetical protein